MLFNVNHSYGWNPKNVGTFLGPSIPGRQPLVRLREKVGAEQRQIRCLESEKITHTSDEREREGRKCLNTSPKRPFSVNRILFHCRGLCCLRPSALYIPASRHIISLIPGPRVESSPAISDRYCTCMYTSGSAPLSKSGYLQGNGTGSSSAIKSISCISFPTRNSCVINLSLETLDNDNYKAACTCL